MKTAVAQGLYGSFQKGGPQYSLPNTLIPSRGRVEHGTYNPKPEALNPLT